MKYRAPSRSSSRSRQPMSMTCALVVVILIAMIAPAAFGQKQPITTPIQHVVIIVKENRGFNHMFGQFPGVAGVTQGPISTGQILPLSHSPDTQSRDYCHTWNCNIVAMDGANAPGAVGRMDKWDVTVGDATFACNLNGDYACYSQYQQADLPNYWTMASNFLIADHMFSSIHATSFPNHVYTVAASSYGIFGQPHLLSNGLQGESGCNSDPNSTVNVIAANGDLISPFPCFDFQSIADLLSANLQDNNGQAWHYYSPAQSSYNPLQAINHLVNNPTIWDSHVFLNSQFVTDAANGNLAAVNYVVTDDPTSEHPPWSICNGENWSVSLVNAVMNNPAYWDNTAIFIYWDDNGGFYDNVSPEYIDQFGLGPRVPLIIVSPYTNVANGHVTHTIYESSSVLRFIEDVFNLPNLGQRDANPLTNDVINEFNFNQSPIPPLSPALQERSCPSVSNSNTTLTFPLQQVGTSSASRAVTVSNFSSGTIDVGTVTATGDFTASTACNGKVLGQPDPNPQQCSVNVTFKPTASGTRTGTLTVPESGSGTTQTVPLSGIGTEVGFTPSLLSFGTVQKGMSKMLSSTFKNSGTTTLTIDTKKVAGDYTETDTCGATLSPGSSCTITVSFLPSTAGVRYGTVTITDSDASSPNVLNLTGIGSDITLAPSSLTFSSTSLGKSSTPQNVTLTNNSNSTLSNIQVLIQQTLQDVNIDFTQTNTCGTSLNAGSNCTIAVTFTPSVQGSRTGDLFIFDSEATTSPQSIFLSGTGQANPAPFITNPLSPTAAVPGGSTFALTVHGSNFVSTSKVLWNGTSMSTTFVSASELQANTPASLIAKAETALITVSNGTPGGGISNLAFFQVTSGSNPMGLPKSSVFVGTTPLGIATADFNGDGNLDIAVANSGSNTISIGLGTGKGTFTAKPVLKTTLSPTAVAVGDFNEDGKLDLAISTQSSTTTNAGSVVIFMGNGDGTFTAVPSSPQTGAGPVAIATADFHQDGRLDVVTANFYENLGSILAGNGDGTFADQLDSANTGVGPDAIAIGDFNGDGFMDLAITSKSDNVVSILPGNGDGSFTWTSGPTPGNQPSAVVTADFNGDGKLDLAVANEADNTVTVFGGNGDGTFTTGSTLTTGTGPVALAVGDFNGDGVIDLASANATSSTASIFLGNGDGTFQTASSSNTGNTPAGMVTGDFNNDGKLDLAITNSKGGSVTILTNGGSGGGGPIVQLSPTSLTFSTQLITTQSPSQNVMLMNTGTGTLDITSVAVSGDFLDTNSCQSTLAPGASCNVGVTFKPKTIGTRTGSLTITDNAPGSPQSVPLTGVGTEVELVPPALTFGNQKVGTKSTPQVITLTNFGVTVLNLTTIKITGADNKDFTDTTTCSPKVPLSQNQTCTISVTFAPTATGTRTANVSIADNGGGSPQLVPLTGTGD